jgi:hypothetical protein
MAKTQRVGPLPDSVALMLRVAATAVPGVLDSVSLAAATRPTALEWLEARRACEGRGCHVQTSCLRARLGLSAGPKRSANDAAGGPGGSGQGEAQAQPVR